MHRSIFSYILAFSAKQQLIVFAMTICSLPFYYVSLDIPKRIVNQAIDASPDKFPQELKFAGLSLATLDQLEFLFTLCGVFLLLVLINGGFKYVINVYKGLLGERMLRRLRYQLYSLILRFPLSQFRKVSQGEMVSIVSSEVEPLGGFIGDAFALPLYQGGLLLTALGFIFVQDPVMGVAVIALYPIQAVIIPRLQFQVNQLGKQRVREVRRLSNQVTEAMSLVREIRANDTERYELAGFTSALSRIFDIRYQIYRKKFFIKFLNNFLAQLTPFFFFSIGGYLVIEGSLTIGALVAVLAAYKDLAPPWKELLDYYQAQQDARIRYEQIVAQFDVPGLDPPDTPVALETEVNLPEGDIIFEDIGYSEDGTIHLSNLTTRIHPGEHVAIFGDADSGRDTLALIAAGLVAPTSGRVRFGETSIETLPTGLIGRTISFADRQPALLTGTLRDNLHYGLKHDPHIPAVDTTANSAQPDFSEAEKTGNSLDDPDADWIDYQAAGVRSSDELSIRAVEALRTADLDAMLYEFGLRAKIDATTQPDIADFLLTLRRMLSDRLSQHPIKNLIEPFNPDDYNQRITVAENLLFGRPTGDFLDLRHLADNHLVRKILRQSKIDKALIDFGFEIAEAAATGADGANVSSIKHWRQLPVQEDELPQLGLIVGLAARAGAAKLPRGYQRTLESLALRFNPARHHSLNLPEELKSQILTARRTIKAKLSPKLLNMIEFFDPDTYNSSLTVRENIIFGEVAPDNSAASQQVNDAISELCDELGAKTRIELLGLDFHLGSGGSNLTPVQRQKLGIARAVIRQPQLLILSNALTGLDFTSAETVKNRVAEKMKGKTILCHTGDTRIAGLFDRTIELRAGTLVEATDAPAT